MRRQGDVAVAEEQLDIGVDVVIGGNSVEDEVEATSVLLHLVGVAENDDFVSPKSERVFLLVGSGEDNNVGSERMSKLHTHVAQSAESDHPNLVALGDAPVAHGRVGGDPAHRSGAAPARSSLDGTRRTKRSSTTMLSEYPP